MSERVIAPEPPHTLFSTAGRSRGTAAFTVGGYVLKGPGYHFYFSEFYIYSISNALDAGAQHSLDNDSFRNERQGLGSAVAEDVTCRVCLVQERQALSGKQ